jgi:hypothetical protein
MNYIPMDQRIAGLERRAFWLSVICIAQLVFVALICICIFDRPTHVLAQTSPNVVRTRGLIIEDAQGRPRILMGAPFPDVRERTRQDGRTTSLLFLDEAGHDRLTLGEELEPQIGGIVSPGIHRIASGFGVVIHDSTGDERGAYGWLSNKRVVMTLDRPGAEALTAEVNDKTGEATLSFDFPPAIAQDARAIAIGTKGATSFIRFADKTGKSLAVFSTENGDDPSFKTFKAQGEPPQEHLNPPH